MSEKMTNADQPINPWTPNSPWDHESAHGFRGLTKREYFAAMAMQGYIASVGQYGVPIEDTLDYLIKVSDIMLEKLDNKQQWNENNTNSAMC